MDIIRIQMVIPLSGYKLKVVFDDNKAVIYDVLPDIEAIPSYRPLIDTYRLFEQAKLDSSRTCVLWTDDIDIPADAIYEHGHVC